MQIITKCLPDEFKTIKSIYNENIKIENSNYDNSKEIEFICHYSKNQLIYPIVPE